jgi:hypothetical protein
MSLSTQLMYGGLHMQAIALTQHEAFPGSGTATTTFKYLAESNVCHSCFIMAGWGVRGSNDTDTDAPSSVEPPINLSIDEFIA